MVVTTSTKMPTPTDIAAAMSMKNLLSSDKASKPVNCMESDITAATIPATKCPPITFRGVAATLSGITNTVNAEEAMPTTIAVLKTVSPIRRMKISDTAARPH